MVIGLHAITHWGFPDLFFGVGLILYAGYQLQLDPSHYLWSLIPLLFSFMSLYSLWFILGATSIWFVKIYNVTEVPQEFAGSRAAIRSQPILLPIGSSLTFVIPVAFLTTVPAEALLGAIAVALVGWNWMSSPEPVLSVSNVLDLCSEVLYQCV